MSIAFLNGKARESFILFIATRYVTNSEQRALVTSTLSEFLPLPLKMKYDASAYEFASRLIDECEKYGVSEAGESPLIAIRDALKANTGEDNKAQLDSYFILTNRAGQQTSGACLPHTAVTVVSESEDNLSLPSLDTPSRVPKRLFISYKMDTAEWNESVWRFAATLSSDGFPVKVAIPGLDLDGLTIAEWSDREIVSAEIVLVCCSSLYKDVVDRKQEPKKGLGVAVEVAAIRRELYAAAGINKKYVPVLLPGVLPESIPDLLSGYPYATYPRDYGLLRQHLVGLPGVIFPTSTALRVDEPKFIAPDRM